MKIEYKALKVAVRFFRGVRRGVGSFNITITYEGNLIKAITRIINIQRVGFSYSLLFTKMQKLKG